MSLLLYVLAGIGVLSVITDAMAFFYGFYGERDKERTVWLYLFGGLAGALVLFLAR